jgi:hypothetical protein
MPSALKAISSSIRRHVDKLYGLPTTRPDTSEPEANLARFGRFLTKNYPEECSPRHRIQRALPEEAAVARLAEVECLHKPHPTPSSTRSLSSI